MASERETDAARHWLFGYGSIVNEASRRSTLLAVNAHEEPPPAAWVEWYERQEETADEQTVEMSSSVTDAPGGGTPMGTPMEVDTAKLREVVETQEEAVESDRTPAGLKKLKVAQLSRVLRDMDVPFKEIAAQKTKTHSSDAFSWSPKLFAAIKACIIGDSREST